MSLPQSDSSSGHDRIARRFLRQQHKDLLDVLNLEEVKVELYSDGVLDTQVQEKLINPSFGARNKLQELLFYLTRQGEPGLLALIGALKKCGDDPSQAKLGIDLEQQYRKFLSTNSSIGSTDSGSIASSNLSRRTSDLDESDASSYSKPPVHVGVLDWPRPQNPKHIKIVVIGPPGSGKTSLMLRYTRGYFDILNPRSRVVEFSSKHYIYDGLEYLLEFHDTPGHNRYDSIVAQYWRNTHGALVIYDITSQQSLADALEWKKHLDKVIIQQDGNCIPAILIGNKHDKMEQNKQGFEAPLTIWKEHEFVEFFATSVKTEYNVANSVEFLVDKILLTGMSSTHYLPDYRTPKPKIEQIANPTTNESSKCCQ